jgi:thioredoxin 1
MKFIHDTNEFETVLNESNALIVKFTAEWCKPCKAVQPVFQEIANKYCGTMEASNVNFAIVDVDELDDVASRYKVTMMPTFISFKDGKYMDSMSGINASKLETFVKRTLS